MAAAYALTQNGAGVFMQSMQPPPSAMLCLLGVDVRHDHTTITITLLIVALSKLIVLLQVILT